MSKYEIKENQDKTHTLWRYNEAKGMPNNAEFQFWCERDEAREERDILQSRIKELEEAVLCEHQAAVDMFCKYDDIKDERDKLNEELRIEREESSGWKQSESDCSRQFDKLVEENKILQAKNGSLEAEIKRVQTILYEIGMVYE